MKKGQLMEMFELYFTNGDVVVTPEDFIPEWRWEYAGNGHALITSKRLAK
jgi:hypothetical protein